MFLRILRKDKSHFQHVPHPSLPQQSCPSCTVSESRCISVRKHILLGHPWPWPVAEYDWPVADDGAPDITPCTNRDTSLYGSHVDLRTPNWFSSHSPRSSSMPRSRSTSFKSSVSMKPVPHGSHRLNAALNALAFQPLESASDGD